MLGRVQIAYKTESESGSAGPEDSMLEQRVATLETDVSKIKTILERLEPKITDILQNCAKRTDLELLRSEMKLGLEGLRSETRLEAESIRSETRLEAERIRADARVEIEKVRGDVREIGGRVSMLPTTYTNLGIVFATWGIGSGLLIFTLTRLLGK